MTHYSDFSDQLKGCFLCLSFRVTSILGQGVSRAQVKLVAHGGLGGKTERQWKDNAQRIINTDQHSTCWCSAVLHDQLQAPSADSAADFAQGDWDEEQFFDRVGRNFQTCSLPSRTVEFTANRDAKTCGKTTRNGCARQKRTDACLRT